MKSTVGSSSKMPTDAGFSDSSESEHLVQHKFHLHISKQNKTWKMKKEDWKESPREEIVRALTKKDELARRERLLWLRSMHKLDRDSSESPSPLPRRTSSLITVEDGPGLEMPGPGLQNCISLNFVSHIYQFATFFTYSKTASDFIISVLELTIWLSAHYWCHFTMLSFKPRINVWVFHHIYYLSIYKFIFCMRNSHFY